jgi:hypothetical protein
MNATHFIHAAGHLPLNSIYPGSDAKPHSRFFEEFPPYMTEENVLKFKPIGGDKGLRNATWFYWNLKKIKVSMTGNVTYYSYTDPDGEGPGEPESSPVSESFSKSHTSYDGGHNTVAPDPKPESEIPQPVSRSEGGESFPYTLFYDIAKHPDTNNFTEAFHARASSGTPIFVKAIESWCLGFGSLGYAAFAELNEEGFTSFEGAVEWYFITPREDLGYESSRGSCIMPDVFEDGCAISYKVTGTPSDSGAPATGSVSVTIEAEYWTYD